MVRYLKWKEQTLSFEAYYLAAEKNWYWELPPDQTTAENLRKADYMLAEATNQTAGLAVPLTFKHQLAKVTVLLTSGDEEDGETFSAMSIYTRGSRIAISCPVSPSLIKAKPTRLTCMLATMV